MLFDWLIKRRKSDQQKYDKALIAMPSCLVSSAYRNNPYYHNFITLKKWGLNQMKLYRANKRMQDCLITNEVDCRQVEQWMKLLQTL